MEGWRRGKGGGKREGGKRGRGRRGEGRGKREEGGGKRKEGRGRRGERGGEKEGEGENEEEGEEGWGVERVGVKAFITISVQATHILLSLKCSKRELRNVHVYSHHLRWS